MIATRGFGIRYAIRDSRRAAAMKATAPFAFRYQYLAGGANTGNGWATWNANGDFARFVLPHEFEHAFEDLPQARRKIRATRADRTARHVMNIALPPVDDAEARVL